VSLSIDWYFTDSTCSVIINNGRKYRRVLAIETTMLMTTSVTLLQRWQRILITSGTGALMTVFFVSE